MSTTANNGAVTPPAAPSAAAKRIEVPTGPVTGRAGEAVLAKAIENAFLEPAAAETSPEGAAGKPAPAVVPKGGEAEVPAKENLPPDAGEAGGDEPAAEPAAATELSAEEQAALAERAKANGVTPEEQHAAEAAELARLEAKAQAEGKTVEEVAAAEEAEAAAKLEKTFTQKEVEEMVTKRVKNLAAENAELKRQLETKPMAPAGAGLLDHVSDPAKLADAESQAQAGLETADDLLSQLGSDPEGVEETLRKTLGKAADEMDMSPRGMAVMLRNAKKQFQATLKAVPQRKAYLAAAAEAEPIAMNVHGWLAEPEDPRAVMFKKFELQMPQLKVNPAWKYWLACAVDRHVQLTEAAQKAEAAKGKPAAKAGKFVPKVTFPKTAARGGGMAPKVATGSDRIAQLKAAVKADPTNEKKQEALLQAMMGD